MIEYLLIFGAGSALTLYLTHSTFKKKVDDLARHIRDLFRDKPVSPPDDPSFPLTPVSKP